MLIVPLAALACLLAMGALSYVGMQQNEQRMRGLKDVTLAAERLANKQVIALSQVHADAYARIAIAASLSEAQFKQFGAHTDGQLNAIAQGLTQLKTYPGAATEAAQALPAVERYRSSVAQALDLASMDPNTGVAAMQNAATHYQQVRTQLRQVLLNLDRRTADALQDTRSAGQRAAWLQLGTMALGFAVLALIATSVARSVLRPIAEACRAAVCLAAGDLTTRIEVRSDDEVGKLSRALATVLNNWNTLLGDIRQAGATITVEAGEIALGNADLSARTESQAQSLQETASSMHALTGTVRENASHAHQANQMVLSTSNVALEGGRVVGQVVETMGSIKASSGRIVDIIAVIDGIAFQTNILALNAAVEAARAGEQGRGFAVVATEVRGLAQRSATAAREIKQLIEDSVDRIETGSRLADSAGRTMGEIVAAVQQVTAIMNDITAASERQSQGIEQVNSAITDMDELTQRNAALVEQSAAAAQNMQDQARDMLKVVDAFRLGDAARTLLPP
ncbi:chemotaxis protein [Janthinobacterium sp. 1_2014MBL_MicDiv]|nr:methyl-accepting chemotaxis protein [Janthinobacterium sp. 1_2014MBL_MicDiv]APA71342.1 chemotaxis protein [Janthinobacterium sp. 1_2014MBL_MicDiv]